MYRTYTNRPRWHFLRFLHLLPRLIPDPTALLLSWAVQTFFVLYFRAVLSNRLHFEKYILNHLRTHFVRRQSFQFRGLLPPCTGTLIRSLPIQLGTEVYWSLPNLTQK
jgi:hypothetical protein